MCPKASIFDRLLSGMDPLPPNKLGFMSAPPARKCRAEKSIHVKPEVADFDAHPVANHGPNALGPTSLPEARQMLPEAPQRLPRGSKEAPQNLLEAPQELPEAPRCFKTPRELSRGLGALNNSKRESFCWTHHHPL